MLSRTASQLYWMSRYVERAENLVRMLDVTQSLSMLPQSHGARTELAAPLAVTGSLQAYGARHEQLDAQQLFDFMALDLDNPASVLSCLKQARENAHAVRGQITAEMWEAINSTWLEARSLPKRGVASVSSFFDWVKERSHLFRGATYGTLQRNDAYMFIRLGTFIERADNTARLLDVKSQLIEPAVDSLSPVDAPSESAPDFYAWSALLRSLSAFEAYHAIYRDNLDGRRVTELLILRPDVPRSLRACSDEIVAILPHIEARAGSEDAGRVAKQRAGQLALRLSYGTADEVLTQGIHGWLTGFLEESAGLGDAIRRAYFEAG
ncbi:alpha-E domain-containing protein [Pelomonas sp. SE-A7]|uniref:alpha-E domain-containing protein n=1 Tax=Pelomonas sp. SE-A7 TaxID=3054953 RepID=UPI00259C98B3|nr:alpha-E domain-containing protein [Pelomonas sp. SE-A7]MDM4768341.1 alpha-E domain-containing protein [Pelomonas sp. SE-A7]